jgi:RimJ/RimL family protein N-acetyltransferase
MARNKEDIYFLFCKPLHKIPQLIIIRHESFLRVNCLGATLFISLPQDQYHSTRPLFAALDYHLIIEAVFAGNSPATLFVDNLDSPKTAFMISPEGNFLVGDSTNTAFILGLQAWIDQNFINGEEDELVLESYSEDWLRVIESLLVSRPPHHYDRYYYELTESKFESPPPLAPEFSLQAITKDFIQRSDISNMDVVTDGIKGNWISEDVYFEKGFGFCILHENKIVSWSVVDCVVDERCEIGIHTDEDFRRKGLATSLIASVVDYALKQGFKRIGWHCWVDNWGSIGVADKVCFVQKRTYPAILCLQSYFAHFAMRGFKRLQVKDYASAEAEYRIAIEKENEAEAEPYLLRTYFEMARVQAGLGNEQAAFEYLKKSLEAGLDQYPEAAQKASEFDEMRKSEQWQALFS